jgi:ribosomal protein S19
MLFNIIDPRINRTSFLSNKAPVNAKFTKKSAVYTYLRASRIPLNVLNKRVAVYNGSTFISFIVKPFMLNYKFGVFSRTKKLGGKIHEKIKKAKNKSKKK